MPAGGEPGDDDGSESEIKFNVVRRPHMKPTKMTQV